MGVVREPDDVDLIVASGRWSPDASAEAAIWLAGYRHGRSEALSPTELADVVLKLPTKQRSQLIQQLTANVPNKSRATPRRRRRTKCEKAGV